MKIEISKDVQKEFEYMAELLTAEGKEWTASQIVHYVLYSIAEGSRRPGSWERRLLHPMGLVADCAAHEAYRQRCGDPKNWKLGKGEKIINTYREDMDLWLITIDENRPPFMPTGDLKGERPKP